MSTGQLYDAGSTILQQRLSRVEGVGPGVRRRQLAAGGARRAEPAGAQPLRPRPRGRARRRWRPPTSGARRASSSTATRTGQIETDDQLHTAEQYRPLIVAWQRRRAAAARPTWPTSQDSVEDLRAGGLANGKPAVLVVIFRSPGANIIATVDRVRAALPQLEASLPAAINGVGRPRPHADDPRLAARRRADAGRLGRSWSRSWCSRSCAARAPRSSRPWRCRCR